MLNAGVTLTAAVAILSYAKQSEIARGYVVIALPCLTGFDLGARYLLRKRLHRLRTRGVAMRRVVAVGHARVAAALATELRRETYHGLQVVAACVADPDTPGDDRRDPVRRRPAQRAEAVATSRPTPWPCWPARR